MYTQEQTLTNHPQSKKIVPWVPSQDNSALFDQLNGLDREGKKQVARTAYIDEVPINIHKYKEVLLQRYNEQFSGNPEKPAITNVFYHRQEYKVPGEADINFNQTKYETLQRLEWSTMEQDFDAWQAAIDLIAHNSHLEDDEFNEQIVPQLRTLLLTESPLFNHMASGDIDVTNTHRRLNKTPYEHTFDVLMAMNTADCNNGRQRSFRRIKALFHDIGKSIVANHDFMQNHAAFSQSFLIEFAMRRWKMSAKEAMQFTLMERWHHTAELMDMKVLDSHDVINQVYDNIDILMDGSLSHLDTPEFHLATLCALNVADTESVKMYEFTAGAIVHTFELFKDVSDRLKGLPEPWLSLLSQMGREGISWLSQLEVSQVEIQEKISQFLQLIDEIVAGINGLSPEDMAEFVHVLFDQAEYLNTDSPVVPKVAKPLAKAA